MYAPVDLCTLRKFEESHTNPRGKKLPLPLPLDRTGQDRTAILKHACLLPVCLPVYLPLKERGGARFGMHRGDTGTELQRYRDTGM